MPFDPSSSASRHVAVIGGGISGMGAAHLLADDNRVTLFEAEPRIGGHARTVFAGKRGDQPVDTGFIVFNYANYPLLTALFDELDVPVCKSDMSFAASLKGGALEYGLENLSKVFAQKRNALNPKFLGMIRDIFRFNARAVETASKDQTLPLRAFLEELGTGQWFRDYYLLPLSGAIWSTPLEKILDFPAYALINFFENHALLHHSGQHQWYTVEGGSREYVDRLETAMIRKGVNIRTRAPIASVKRHATGVEVLTRCGAREQFDDVVFATHADDSLAMLSDATPKEHEALSAVRYQPNDIILHRDESVMPQRRVCWSSWNYTEAADATSDRIDLTYWMNKLQPIPLDDPMFVTLNTRRTIRDEDIFDRVTLRHPVFDLAVLAAQDRIRARNGENNTWFCGAWMKNGFHEDGLSSAVEVVERFRQTRPQSVVAA